MATMVLQDGHHCSKVIDMGVIRLSLDFRSVAVQMVEIWTFKEIQDGRHDSRMGTKMAASIYGSN